MTYYYLVIGSLFIIFYLKLLRKISWNYLVFIKKKKKQKSFSYFLLFYFQIYIMYTKKNDMLHISNIYII